MSAKSEFNQHPMEWLYRVIIIGLMSWAGTSLYSLDKQANVVEFRLTALETSITAHRARHDADARAANE